MSNARRKPRIGNGTRGGLVTKATIVERIKEHPVVGVLTAGAAALLAIVTWWADVSDALQQMFPRLSITEVAKELSDSSQQVRLAALAKLSHIDAIKVSDLQPVARALEAYFNDHEREDAKSRSRLETVTALNVLSAVLKHADDERIALVRPTITGLRLRSSELSKIYLRGVTLIRSDLRNANMHGANLSETRIQDTDMADVQAKGLILYKAVFDRSCLAGSKLADARLTDAQIIHSDWSNADLQGALLVGTVIAESNWDRVVMNGADVSRADFRSAQGISASQFHSAAQQSELRLPDKYYPPRSTACESRQ